MKTKQAKSAKATRPKAKKSGQEDQEIQEVNPSSFLCTTHAIYRPFQGPTIVPKRIW